MPRREMSAREEGGSARTSGGGRGSETAAVVALKDSDEVLNSVYDYESL